MKQRREGYIKVFEGSKVDQTREIHSAFIGVVCKAIATTARQEYEWRRMAMLKDISLVRKQGSPLLAYE
eukprot:11188969-Lingulodinium_polyedra.AAC.1